MNDELLSKEPAPEQVMAMVKQVVSIIGDKWTLLIIRTLAFEKSPNRFNQLMQNLKPISSRTLAAKLTNLIEQGIIEKTIVHSSPPSSRYSLTMKGQDLVTAFKCVIDWNLKWQQNEILPSKEF